MDDETFREEMLKKTERLIKLYEHECQKPRFTKVTKAIAWVVTLLATGFAARQSYTAYERYALERSFASHYKSVGDEFLRKEQYQRALDAFREADKLRPFDGEIYFGRVKALALLTVNQKKDLDIAEMLCNLLIRQDPNSPEAYRYLGIVYMNEEKYSQAENAYGVAIQKNGGKYGAAEYDLGLLYTDQGRTAKLRAPGSNEWGDDIQKSMDKTQKALKDGTDQDPYYTKALYTIACDYALLGKPDKAIQGLKIALDHRYDRYHVIAEDPDLDSLRRNSSFAQLIRDKRSEISKEYRGLIQAGEIVPEAYHTLAWAQLYSNDPSIIKEGIEYANRALLSEPANPTFEGTLAELYAASGDYKLALEKIKLAIDKEQPPRSYYLDLRKSWEGESWRH